MKSRTRRIVLGIGALLWALPACTMSGAPPPSRTPTAAIPLGGGAVPVAELLPAADAGALLSAARALMVADENVALVTVDSAGQPRVRSVRAFLDPVHPARPASGVTVWIMTRLDTRKVEQIRRHPQVALYFNDDAKVSYATIMGTAFVHTDPEHPGAKRHYDAEYATFFWPDFPRDFVMLEVRPRWLEFMGPDVPNDRRTWRPQSVVFDR